MGSSLGLSHPRAKRARVSQPFLRRQDRAEAGASWGSVAAATALPQGPRALPASPARPPRPSLGAGGGAAASAAAPPPAPREGRGARARAAARPDWLAAAVGAGLTGGSAAARKTKAAGGGGGGGWRRCPGHPEGRGAGGERPAPVYDTLAAAETVSVRRGKLRLPLLNYPLCVFGEALTGRRLRRGGSARPSPLREGARSRRSGCDCFSSVIGVESATHTPEQQRLLLAYSSVSFVSEFSKVVILQVPALS